MSVVSNQTQPRKLDASKAYVALLDARDDANKVVEALAVASPAAIEQSATRMTADLAFTLGGKVFSSQTYSKYAALYLVKNAKTIAPAIMDLITTDVLAQKTEAETEMGLNGLTTTPIIPPEPSITSALTVTATTTQAFAYQIMANNISGPGISSATYDIRNAPAWLKVNATTGLVTGVPAMTDVGQNTFDIVVTTNVASDVKTVTVDVEPHTKPVVIPDQTATGTSGSPFSYTVKGQYATAGVNGVTSVQWSSDDLPAGLSIAEDTGVVSGTPTAGAGTYTPTIELTNDYGSDSDTITITLS